VENRTDIGWKHEIDVLVKKWDVIIVRRHSM